MKTIIKDCAPQYTIIGDISSNVYHVTDNSNDLVLKILTVENHPFTTVRIKVENLLQRSICMTKLFSDLGLGPHLYDSFICKNKYLVLITKYIPYALTNEALENPDIVKAIESKITDMHSLGLIHGDLHGGNIRYDENKHIYFVDVDTAFTKEEYESLNFPELWIKKGFDIDTLQDFIEQERYYNYMVIPD